jgi:hypothetical protein
MKKEKRFCMDRIGADHKSTNHGLGVWPLPSSGLRRSIALQEFRRSVPFSSGCHVRSIFLCLALCLNPRNREWYTPSIYQSYIYA